MTHPRTWRRRYKRNNVLLVANPPDLATWQQHHYVPKLQALLTTGRIPTLPGAVVHITVAHDHDCHLRP